MGELKEKLLGPWYNKPDLNYDLEYIEWLEWGEKPSLPDNYDSSITEQSI